MDNTILEALVALSAQTDFSFPESECRLTEDPREPSILSSPHRYLVLVVDKQDPHQGVLEVARPYVDTVPDLSIREELGLAPDGVLHGWASTGPPNRWLCHYENCIHPNDSARVVRWVKIPEGSSSFGPLADWE